ncbi:MAG: biotin--[acetyl-CoA-carboxylase] ligase, partial [Atopostipes suicloacalis]|nr:biotin--[acetyl-CoA-carboxylase] ligase [Atopostipes suicloacalis]
GGYIRMTRTNINLSTVWKNLDFQSYQSLASTNETAKDYLKENPKSECLILTAHQTDGRGRNGRHFYSELDQGLYFSLAIQLKEKDMMDLTLYTIAAASAMIQAIEEEFGLKLKVKWVNDLFYHGKKVAGILTEAITDPKTNKINSLIIGIGMNLMGEFSKADESTQKTAGSLFERIPSNFSLETLLSKFLKFFSSYHKNLQTRNFLPIYEERLLGRKQKIYYLKKGEKHKAWIQGIDHDGQLLVKNEEGSIESLISNEIHFSSQQFVKNREIE